MKSFEAKPHKLVGKIQNYEWGTKNKNAFIPKFLGVEPEKDVPYAEYWIGVHPKAPSDLIIDGEDVSLIQLLNEFPKEILGERVASKFNNSLPYLLKVLSINQALSIQSHPDKKLAKILHSKDPKNYPDDNHKPEIAIAIDNLTALVGLKPLREIRVAIIQNPEIEELLSDEVISRMADFDYKDETIIKELYSEIMNSSNEDLGKCIILIKSRLESKEILIQSEKQFLLQHENYGIDVGLISILLFNITNLKSGEAIFTPAGIPHAYIIGNIVECMANSDNVVRAGLTPKYQDIETLTEMLEIDSSQAIVDIYEKSDRIIYKTSAEEFEIEKLLLKERLSIHDNSEVKMMLILDGEISVEWNDRTEKYTKGSVCLIPANLSDYIIEKVNDSSVYQINIP